LQNGGGQGQKSYRRPPHSHKSPRQRHAPKYSLLVDPERVPERRGVLRLIGLGRILDGMEIEATREVVMVRHHCVGWGFVYAVVRHDDGYGDVCPVC
jgi:hypothetical protein